jgi:hypothetical protein
MQELTVTEYAKLKNISREAVHYQIKNKKIKFKKKNKIFYVLIDENLEDEKPTIQELESVIKLLEQENKFKDQILRNKDLIIENQKETIEAEKRTAQALLYTLDNHKKEEERLLLENKKIIKENEEKYNNKLIPLNEFLLNLGFDEKARKRVKKRFNNRVNKEERIIKKEGYFYLDLQYSYKDIIY